jgi:hypothetical protein
MSAFIGGNFSMDRMTNTLASPITANDDIRSGAETPSFDTIRMEAVPEPAIAALFFGLAATTVLIRRHRHKG